MNHISDIIYDLLIYTKSLPLYRLFLATNRVFALDTISKQEKYTKILTTCLGGQIWILNGRYHRDGDLPAVDLPSFNEYYRHGRLHREGDQPASIHATLLMWYVDGLQHRDGDKPAIISKIHDYTFYAYIVNGRKHRAGGKPAIIKGREKEYWMAADWADIFFIIIGAKIDLI